MRLNWFGGIPSRSHGGGPVGSGGRGRGLGSSALGHLESRSGLAEDVRGRGVGPGGGGVANADAPGHTPRVAKKNVEHKLARGPKVRDANTVGDRRPGLEGDWLPRAAGGHQEGVHRGTHASPGPRGPAGQGTE